MNSSSAPNSGSGYARMNCKDYRGVAERLPIKPIQGGKSNNIMNVIQKFNSDYTITINDHGKKHPAADLIILKICQALSSDFQVMKEDNNMVILVRLRKGKQ